MYFRFLTFFQFGIASGLLFTLESALSPTETIFKS